MPFRLICQSFWHRLDNARHHCHIKLQTSDKQKADIENVEGNLSKRGKQSRFKQRWQPCNVKSPLRESQRHIHSFNCKNIKHLIFIVKR
jgi:hypothetical protein